MITEEKSSGLSESEMHNIILTEIHNRLAEISRFLEVISVKYARLDHIDTDTITEDHKIDMYSLPNDFEKGKKYELRRNHYRPIGYTEDKGLYMADEENFSDNYYKLSDEKTARPVDEDNYFLTDAEIENKWGKEALMAIKKKGTTLYPTRARRQLNKHADDNTQTSGIDA